MAEWLKTWALDPESWVQVPPVSGYFSHKPKGYVGQVVATAYRNCSVVYSALPQKMRRGCKAVGPRGTWFKLTSGYFQAFVRENGGKHYVYTINFACMESCHLESRYIDDASICMLLQLACSSQ